MKLSIVVPVYNTETYLVRCINSLLDQTINQKEIILVNDASPDNSLAILTYYENKYPSEIKVINLTQNSGPGGARNAGILASKGEYIGFVDSDDFVHPEMYETMLNKAESDNADIVDCDLVFVDADGKKVSIEVSNTDDQIGILDDNKRKKLILSPGRIVTKIFKRELFISNKIFFREKAKFEDNDLIPLMVVLANIISKVHSPYYNYVMSANSICRVKTKSFIMGDRYFDDRISSSSSIIKRFIDHGLYLSYQEEVDFLVYQLYYINTLFGTYERYNSLPYHKLKELNNVKNIVPGIRSNRYFNKLDWKTKFWINANSIHPRLFKSLYSLNETINITLKRTKS